MGQYKVPQDVEAEDKIIGNLTLKQFLFAVAGAGWLLASFAALRKLPVFFIAFGLPPATILLLLGLFQRQDQPFEAIFLAFVSFISKPRRRLWAKEPIAEVFKIEPAPAVLEQAGRDPREVQGQLERLVKVFDTRGWSAKQPEIQEPAEELPEAEERLAAPQTLAPVGNIVADVGLADDILDFQNNPNAQNVNQLIEGATKSIRAEAVQKLQVVRSEERVASKTKPTHTPHSPLPTTNGSVSGMSVNPLDAILKQALDSGDLKVSQIAQQANKPQNNLTEGQPVNLRDGK
jgi:hypothetical protein